MQFKSILVAALAAFSLSAAAQDAPKEKFHPHWTLGLQGGIGYSHGEHKTLGDVINLLLSSTSAVTLAAGKVRTAGTTTTLPNTTSGTMVLLVLMVCSTSLTSSQVTTPTVAFL